MSAAGQWSMASLRHVVRNPPTLLQIIGGLIALALLGPLLEIGKPSDGYTIQWRMATSAQGPAQLFADHGAGYSPENVHDVSVTPDGVMRTLRADLKGALPKRVRIDPASGVGPITIEWIELSKPGHVQRLEGKELRSRVTLLNQLQQAATNEPILRLAATGADPYFDFAVGSMFGSARGALRALAGAIGALIASVIGFWLFHLHRRRVVATMERAAPRTRAITLVVLTLAGAGALLWVSGLRCERMLCSPRGWLYGSALFMALAEFSVVGLGALAVLRIERRPSLFVAILTGQVVFVAYIYVRSVLTQLLPTLPMTRYELLLLVAVTALLAWRRGLLRSAVEGRAASLALQAMLLGMVCVVLADRELPRLAMLSSDPDTHAFLARQLERFGGIYKDQGGWGSEPMTYPAGSASLIFAWASLSFLDVRNALAVLPMVLTLLASLAIAERTAREGGGKLGHALAMVSAIGVTSVALAFPLYQNFAHMEGTGRLLSIGMAALACLLLARFVAAAKTLTGSGEACLLALVVFCLASLNPANVAAVSLIVTAVALVSVVKPLRATLLLASLPFGLLPLLLDPYYYGMLTGADAAQKVTLAPGLAPLTAQQLIDGWSEALLGDWKARLGTLLKMMPWHATPTFGVLGVALLLPLLAARSWAAEGAIQHAPSGRWIAVTLLWFAGALLGIALLEPFARDPRAFLLTQYYPMVLAQYKALALVALASLLVVAAVRARGVAAGALAIAGAFGLAALVLRPVQPMALAASREYCGTVGCVKSSDVEVVEKLERLVAQGSIARADGSLPRVLVPNQEVQAGYETWMFPIGGSRYLAMADALPVAFFYHQGDADYSSRNYQTHVCESLDRAWLARENIRYVFLPADRPRTCAGVTDALTLSERVLLNSGDTWLLELRLPEP